MSNPKRFRSPNTKWEFNVDKANALLDKCRLEEEAPTASARRTARRLKLRLPDLHQRHAPEGAGRSSSRRARRPASIVELKSVIGLVFFSSDVANPDTYPEVLGRHADVHHHGPNRRTRRQRCSPFLSIRDRAEGRTSGRAATSAAGSQPRLRRALPFRPVRRARPGQARRHLHPHERHGRRPVGIVIPLVIRASGAASRRQ